jgi:23S rRNA maturation mini-RNase III
MSMTRAEKCLAQAQVFQTRAIHGAIKALVLAVMGDVVPDTEVRRELEGSQGQVSKMDEAVDKALQYDQEDQAGYVSDETDTEPEQHDPALPPPSSPRRPRRRRSR